MPVWFCKYIVLINYYCFYVHVSLPHPVLWGETVWVKSESVADLFTLTCVNMWDLTQKTSIDARSCYVNISLLHFV
jgi:hypothetical protein